MGSSDCRAPRAEKLVVALALLAACAACTSQSVVPQQSAAAFDAGVELPAGPGREIVVAQCLVCHELAALELFTGFYTHESWRSLVISMRAHGAELDDVEVEAVSRYLTRHFGVGAR